MIADFLQNTLHFFQSIDSGILLLIQNYLRMEWLSPIMVTISRMGDMGIFWIVLSVILLINKRTRRVGLLALFALAVTFVIYHFGIKPYVGRVRPYDAIDALHRLVPKETDGGSFPSGHAASAFAVAVMVFRGCRRWFGVPVLCFAFVMAFSRLYVGVHYPSDVIVGAALGTVVACIFFALFASREMKKREKRNR